MIKRAQLIFIGIFIALFCLIYWGLDTKPKNHEQIEKSRALNFESTNINNLLMEAYKDLSKNDNDYIKALELQLSNASSDSLKLNTMEQLSASWFRLGFESIAGHYAESIAKIRNDEDSWSITGTTYAAGIRNAKTEKEKDFCYKKAVQALENAISLNPNNINHKVNLAICSAEYPPKDNPMKGIMMLLDLDKKHPDSVPVLYQLARFGAQTNQFEKASKRLERVLEINPEHKKSICLLSSIYDQMGLTDKANALMEKCNN